MADDNRARPVTFLDARAFAFFETHAEASYTGNRPCAHCDRAAQWFVDQRFAPTLGELVAVARALHRSADASVRGFRPARVRILDAEYDETAGYWHVPRGRGGN
ncbi:MAG TPA: hypothetical protein VFI89_09860 [Burkholderiales bacterium]|nr:hypothetical protein [Burkholderiales bacterium]